MDTSDATSATPARFSDLYKGGEVVSSSNHPVQHATLPEMLYSLSSLTTLCEIGLMSAATSAISELYQHILTHLRRVIGADDACLLLYHPPQRRFIAVASQGEKLSGVLLASAIDSAVMEQQAGRGPGETLSTMQIDSQCVALVTLSYNHVLIGVVALAVPAASDLYHERELLLMYLGNIAALLLRNYDLQSEAQKELLEQERSRIARDIHDGAAQQIAHVLYRLEFIQQVLEKQPQPQVLPDLKKVYHTLQNCLNELRHSISSLLPLSVEEQGFIAALKALIDEYTLQHTNMRITYEIDAPHLLPSRLEAPIYRFIQEALNNVLKHAHATNVNIRVRVLTDTLLVEVEDNGIGFQPEQVISHIGGRDSLHLGLSGMRERVRDAGGDWELQSHPGQGTTVKSRFPLTHAVSRLTQRELEVLLLVTEGLSNRQIAQHLTISSETVKTHLHHIMQKLQAKDRTQAAVLAARQGWL